MEGLVTFSAALAFIGILELGDKTQLATISLASRYPHVPVLLGAWLVAIKVSGGVLFILFGVLSFRRSEAETYEPTEPARGAFLRALTVNAIAETGDKTQLAVVTLAATTDAPLSVFAGGRLSLVTAAIVSVLIGAAVAWCFKRRRSVSSRRHSSWRWASS